MIPTRHVFFLAALSFALYRPLHALAAPLPTVSGVDWVETSYEDVERDLIEQFSKDVSRLEELSSDLTVFAVRVNGNVPQDYYRVLKGRIEGVLLRSAKIVLKDCARCDAAVVERTSDTDLTYYSLTDDPKFRQSVARELGTDNLLFIEENYSRSELRLQVRLISAQSGALLWTKEYTSSALAQRLNKAVDEMPAAGASHANKETSLLGGIAFRASFTPGFSYFPTINGGRGSEMIAYPTIGVSLGERFDSGYKEFGFGMYLSFDMTEGRGARVGKPAPFFLQMGPHFKYVFNPYNVTSARWIADFEFGALVSQGLTTAYLGAGPEIRMINRFSIGLIPALILRARAKSPDIKVKDEQGREIPIDAGKDEGEIGGLALLLRANITW